jgi:hypothetical protein
MQQLGVSSNAPKTTSRIRELLWPDVSDLVAVETAARNGMYVSFFIAGVTVLFAVIGWTPRIAIIDAVLFAAIGIGIRKMSRIAAIAGLILYASEQLFSIAQGRIGANIILVVIFTGAFLSAVRAAWAYPRLRVHENAAEEF